MVMKKDPRAKRVGIAEAKAHLSEVLRSAADQPVVIHNRGRDVAVVLAVETYERLRDLEGSAPTDAALFLAEVAELRDRYGGGVDIPYERVDFEPRNPFAEVPEPTKKRRKR